MSKLKNFTFKSNYDQLELAGLCIIPNQPVKAVIQFVHGMAEHKERYLDIMSVLAKEGYMCVIHDHRGHGESVKQEEDLGYFYDEDGFAIVNDTHQLTMMIRAYLPHVSLILCGHSMGSLVVRSYVKRYDQDIDGLIVCGSPSNNSASKAGLKMIRTLKSVQGDRVRSLLVEKMIFGSYNKGLKATSKNSWICSDDEVVKAYDQDPLCGFTFTLNGFENLMCLLRYTYDPKGWAKKNLNMPVFFIAGANDPCIHSKEDFDKAVLCMYDIGYHNLCAKLYKGMRHEILNEINKKVVYDDILAWLNENF